MKTIKNYLLVAEKILKKMSAIDYGWSGELINFYKDYRLQSPKETF